jgi:hypothetical protein
MDDAGGNRQKVSMMYDVRRKSSRVETLSSLFRLLGLSKPLSSILIHTSYIIHTFTFYLLPLDARPCVSTFSLYFFSVLRPVNNHMLPVRVRDQI